MPDPLNPCSSCSLKLEKPTKDVNYESFDNVNIFYRKHNDNEFIKRLLLKKTNLFPVGSTVITTKTHHIPCTNSTINYGLPHKVEFTSLKRNILASILKVLFHKERLVSFKGFKMSGAPGRHMKYPYTLTAKIAQFPYKFYFKNNWLFKYYLLACVVSFPIFYKISRLSNSPENVKKWEEIRRRDFTPGPHHH